MEKNNKHIILKTELQALKTAIGESGYSFALKRAPFLGKIPEALSVSSLQADEYHEHFTLCGLRCLGLALSQIDSAILSRFVLKFPMAHKESLTAPPMSASDEDASNALLLINRIAAELELFNA